MLKRVYIDNYRCFSDFEFKPGRVNLLLGANGSGKSCFVEALIDLRNTLGEGRTVSEAFALDSLTRWREDDEQRFELDVEGLGDLFRYELTVRHQRDKEKAKIVEERVRHGERDLFRFVEGAVHIYDDDGSETGSLQVGGDSSFLAHFEPNSEAKKLAWFLEFIRHVWFVRLNPTAMVALTRLEDSGLYVSGSNFASWYRHLAQESPSAVVGLFAALKEVLPGFVALRLSSEGHGGRSRELVVSFRGADSTYEVAFDELSDGQRVLVVLYTLLEGYERANSALFFDEPGAHVSLAELQPWLRELDERFVDEGQLFVISHHPEVVDFLAASQPWYFSRELGGPANVRAAEFDRDSGMRASKQIQLGLLDD